MPKGNIVRITKKTLMHPMELDTDVIVTLEVMRRNFKLDSPVYARTDLPAVIRRCLVHIEGWRYCSDKGEHEYYGVIPVLATQECVTSNLFTDDEKALGYKEVSFMQSEIILKVE